MQTEKTSLMWELQQAAEPHVGSDIYGVVYGGRVGCMGYAERTKRGFYQASAAEGLKYRKVLPDNQCFCSVSFNGKG